MRAGIEIAGCPEQVISAQGGQRCLPESDSLVQDSLPVMSARHGMKPPADAIPRFHLPGIARCEAWRLADTIARCAEIRERRPEEHRRQGMVPMPATISRPCQRLCQARAVWASH